MTPFQWYLVSITVLAGLVAVYDKFTAGHRRFRVPEAVLFGLAMIGGSAGMYVTMLLIRHKTKHKRFMLGLPAILILQLVVYNVL